MAGPPPAPAVDALLQRAAELERELLDLERRLGTVGAGTRRDGPHLVVEAGGHRALLEAARVVQIARLVEFTPIPGAPPAVLGGFVRRGRQGIAIDLPALLGADREPDLDAHLVILGGTCTLGVLVDRVQHLVEAPVRVDAGTERLLPAFPADLVASWCDVGGWILPLVSLHAIERLALGRDPGAEDRRPAAGEGERT